MPTEHTVWSLAHRGGEYSYKDTSEHRIECRCHWATDWSRHLATVVNQFAHHVASESLQHPTPVA